MEKEFDEFCAGKEDPMLKIIDEEDKKKTLFRAQSIGEIKATLQNSYQLAPSKLFRPDQAKAIIR